MSIQGRIITIIKTNGAAGIIDANFPAFKAATLNPTWRI